MKLVYHVSFILFLSFTNLLATEVSFVEENGRDMKGYYQKLANKGIFVLPHTSKPFDQVDINSAAYLIVRRVEEKNYAPYGRLILRSLGENSDRIDTTLILFPSNSGWDLLECLKLTTKSIQDKGSLLAFKSFGNRSKIFQAIDIQCGGRERIHQLISAGWAAEIYSILHLCDFLVVNYLLPSSIISPSDWSKYFNDKEGDLTKFDIEAIINRGKRIPRSKL